MPYNRIVQTVILTKAFLNAAEHAGMGNAEREALVDWIAMNPTAGDLMKGTGGCRKVRYRKPGTGKSGGYRVVTFFGGADIAVVLLTVFGKSEKANLTKHERNEIAKRVVQLEAELRNNEKRIRQDRRRTR